MSADVVRGTAQERALLAAELIRRTRARASLHSYALNVNIPTVPFRAPCPDEDLLGAARYHMPLHHAIMLDAIQRTVTRPFGRLIITLPPGSAKSTYASVVTPPWVFGNMLTDRIILTSYGSDHAERLSRRAQMIYDSPEHRAIFGDDNLTKEAVADWQTAKGCNLIAAGLTAGITGNRAGGWIVDDPTKGRREADSPADRKKTIDAYQDDLMTRVLPEAWGIVCMTRWHELDLAGYVLPETYDGRSGVMQGRDGLDWEVLNIPAKAERDDDPLGRKVGEYLWPEWFPQKHWHMFENAAGPQAQRTWASLYQGRPVADGSGRFKRDMFRLYKRGEQPPLMHRYGASDCAVTADKNDFTEHGVWGIDSDRNLWMLDWWRKQADPTEWGQAFIDLLKVWKPAMWFNEGGVIDKAARPLLNMLMNSSGAWTDLRSIPSMEDKVAKCSAFQALAGAGKIYLPDWMPESEIIITQLCALPGGRHDDAADVCGLIGRAVEQFMPGGRPPDPNEGRFGPKPFTAAWLEWTEKTDTKEPRFR